MRNEKWVAKITLLMTHSVYMLAATVYFLILFKDKPGWLMFSHMEVIITPDWSNVTDVKGYIRQCSW